MQSVSRFTTVSPVFLPRHRDQRFSVSPVRRLGWRRVAGRIELAARARAIEPRLRGSDQDTDPGEESPIKGEEGEGEGEGEREVEVGLAAELEGLEEAAMAGSDEGREPTDYDRRAHIFYESSRVFRALKDQSSSSSSSK